MPHAPAVPALPHSASLAPTINLLPRASVYRHAPQPPSPLRAHAFLATLIAPVAMAARLINAQAAPPAALC